MHYALLRHERRPDVGLLDREDPRDVEKSGRIRCPRCEWQPKADDLWYCAYCPEPEGFLDGCGTAWNTFETGGRCPGCHHRWRWTSCLACGTWSLHVDWFETSDEPR